MPAGVAKPLSVGQFVFQQRRGIRLVPPLDVSGKVHRFDGQTAKLLPECLDQLPGTTAASDCRQISVEQCLR